MDKTKAVSVLTDLIKVNQDRISAYSKAAATSNKVEDIIKLFEEIIRQATGFIKELQHEIAGYELPLGDAALPHTKVYSTWKDFDIVFSGHNARQLLASCEYGEAALEAVYNSALDETGIPANAVIIILKQRREIKAAHYKIKKQRDVQVLSVEAQGV